MKRLRSDARFDGRMVWTPTLHRPDPIFHKPPDVWSGEGWRGEVRVCNIATLRGKTYHAGTKMPDEVVTPCGLLYWSRLDEPIEVEFTIRYENRARMVNQGQDLPLGHATRIGRPCKKCFPKGWPE